MALHNLSEHAMIDTYRPISAYVRCPLVEWPYFQCISLSETIFEFGMKYDYIIFINFSLQM